MRYSCHVTFDLHGGVNVPISFGAMPVRLPAHSDAELHLVVIRGFGAEPMTLITSLPVSDSFESQWRVVEAYLSRWRIEETIRFVKQEYGLENIRVLSYAGIRNMASLVLASAYFATVWIGRHALNALKDALGFGVGAKLPSEIARLAVGYLAQIDPRAELAVKSLDDQAYNRFLASIGQHPDADILNAAIGALRQAKGDAELQAVRHAAVEEFREIDDQADKVDISWTKVLQLFKNFFG